MSDPIENPVPPPPSPQIDAMNPLVCGFFQLVSGAWHVMRRQREKLAIPYGVAISLAGLWVLGTSYMPPAAAAAGALR